MQSQQICLSDSDNSFPERRLDLLPRWVNTYILYAVFLPIIFISASRIFDHSGNYTSIKFADFELIRFFSLSAFTGYSLILIKIISVYGLWTERNWAVTLAIGDAFLTLTLNLKNLYAQVLKTGAYFNLVNLDTLLLMFFIYFLFSIRKRWKEL